MTLVLRNKKYSWEIEELLTLAKITSGFISKIWFQNALCQGWQICLCLQEAQILLFAMIVMCYAEIPVFPTNSKKDWTTKIKQQTVFRNNLPNQCSKMVEILSNWVEYVVITKGRYSMYACYFSSSVCKTCISNV